MIYVIGIGPGAQEWILPEAIRVMKQMDYLVGGSRHLEIAKKLCPKKNQRELRYPFDDLKEWMRKNEESDRPKKIGVLVSGDPGFHSMLSYLSRHFAKDQLRVIPGISSLQYMFSKMKKGYENARWISLHGTEENLKEVLEQVKCVGILTDRRWNVASIAAYIEDMGYDKTHIWVGQALSYPEESIECLSIQEAKDYEKRQGQINNLTVVVIENE